MSALLPQDRVRSRFVPSSCSEQITNDVHVSSKNALGAPLVRRGEVAARAIAGRAANRAGGALRPVARHCAARQWADCTGRGTVCQRKGARQSNASPLGQPRLKEHGLVVGVLRITEPAKLNHNPPPIYHTVELQPYRLAPYWRGTVLPQCAQPDG